MPARLRLRRSNRPGKRPGHERPLVADFPLSAWPVERPRDWLALVSRFIAMTPLRLWQHLAVIILVGASLRPWQIRLYSVVFGLLARISRKEIENAN
jgi:hypothetical protein